MSNLGPQKILFSYNGLLQVPGGLTSSLQYITDANGVSSGLQISTTGFSGAVISDTVTITGGTINGTTIGAVNPAAGTFSTLKVDSLAGILKATTGTVSAATANTDYLTPPSGTAILKANSGGALANATSGVDYAPATSGSSVLSGNGAGGFTNVSIGPGLTFVGSTISTTTGLDNTKLLASNGLNGFASVTVGSGLQYSGGVLASISGGGSVTTVSVVSANGFTGTVANASSTPAITLATSVTGLLKGNGTAISAATSGTDYAPATSGTSILYGDGAGGFSNVTVGSGLTFVGGTLDAAASGAVTSISIASSNGLAGTSSGGSTPTLTLSTSVSGVVKGNGTSFSAATAGTDYVAPGGALGTPSSGTLTNCTGLPISTGVSGLGTNVATFLATPSSANLAAALTDETGTGANVFATSPTLVTATITGSKETKTAPSISTNTLTLDCSAGNVFAVSLNANITTLSFSNVPSSGTAYALTLSFTADGTARSVTWGSSVKWPSGTAPTLTSTNGKVDTFVLTTWDGGTTWYAFTAGQNA